jgi:hypothetical protein
MKAVESIVSRGGKLTLTSLGRHLSGSAKVKNKIKAVDYLLGNGALYGERLALYRQTSQTLLGGLTEAEILVDWSPCAHHDNQLLKASVVLRGRSMTLYEEVHPEKKLGNYQVHQGFLACLKRIIPKHCHVTVITDAGFKTDWFELVLQQGWDFIGRIRSNMKFQPVGEATWRDCLSEYPSATRRPAFRGEVLLSKANQLRCFMYLYRDKPRLNQQSTKQQKRSTKDKDYSKSSYDPWLLVTSCAGGEAKALACVNSYRKRMKVEHEFRDTKDVQWGIGLSETRTYNPSRLEILLLVGHLALLLLWLVGLATEQQGRHYAYQANTVKGHRVLSLVFLGLQVILHEPHNIQLAKLDAALSLGKTNAIYL